MALLPAAALFESAAALVEPLRIVLPAVAPDFVPVEAEWVPLELLDPAEPVAPLRRFGGALPEERPVDLPVLETVVSEVVPVPLLLTLDAEEVDPEEPLLGSAVLPLPVAVEPVSVPPLPVAVRLELKVDCSSPKTRTTR